MFDTVLIFWGYQGLINSVSNFKRNCHLLASLVTNSRGFQFLFCLGYVPSISDHNANPVSLGPSFLPAGATLLQPSPTALVHALWTGPPSECHQLGTLVN